MEIIKIKGKQYKLKLQGKMIEITERKLGGKSLIDIFMPMSLETSNATGLNKENVSGRMKFPSISELIIIFWAELQVNDSNISLEDTYDLYDDFLEEYEISKNDEKVKNTPFSLFSMLGRGANFFTKEG